MVKYSNTDLHSYWDGEENDNLVQCANCRMVYDMDELEDIKTFSQFYRYCPSCGAKMDGVENG